MTETSETEKSSLEAQLMCLYSDRERLELELGTADAEPILAHIRSLEERLRQAESNLRSEPVASYSTPANNEAEMRLAEVVSERESFFENVASNNFDEVERYISTLRDQVRELEAAMQRTAAENIEPSPAADAFASVEPAQEPALESAQASVVEFDSVASGQSAQPHFPAQLEPADGIEQMLQDEIELEELPADEFEAAWPSADPGAPLAESFHGPVQQASTETDPVTSSPQGIEPVLEMREPAAPFSSLSNSSSPDMNPHPSELQNAPTQFLSNDQQVNSAQPGFAHSPAAALPAPADGNQAADDAQAFVRSLAGLFGNSHFVFEGQTSAGRFRFEAKNS